jgi:hypothetical protein
MKMSLNATTGLPMADVGTYPVGREENPTSVQLL